MNKDQRKIELQGKIIYVAITNGGWAITIMPDEIILDDYHKKGGISTQPFNHEKEIIIKNDELNNNLKIVLNHINKNKGLKLKKLIKELK